MYYYQFNIGDYATATRHLSNTEDLAYRRLIDLYYEQEKPLVKDVKKLSRLINMKGNQEEIKAVLEDFFYESEDGFRQNRIDREIENYHSKADTARANGKKGGRPRKANSNPEETGSKPKKTQLVILANPEETGSKANQEPITNNHKPLTKNQEPKQEIRAKAKRFTPPTLEQIQSLIFEKGYLVEADSFFNHYESNGWMVGKNKMKKWEATLAQWNSRNRKDPRYISQQNNGLIGKDALGTVNNIIDVELN